MGKVRVTSESLDRLYDMIVKLEAMPPSGAMAIRQLPAPPGRPPELQRWLNKKAEQARDGFDKFLERRRAENP